MITFSVADSVDADDYEATVTCGDAEPITITITVTEPVPTITANPSRFTVGVGETGTSTITKSHVTGDLTVTVAGTDESQDVSKITTTINQETCVISFAIDNLAIAGDYVATVTCGDAEPIEITITVTAPAVTVLTKTVRQQSQSEYINFSGQLNVTKIAYGRREPSYSQGDIEWSIDAEHAQLFTVVHTPYFDTTLTTSGEFWRDKFEITQIQTAPADSTTATFTLTCGELTASIVLRCDHE